MKQEKTVKQGFAVTVKDRKYSQGFVAVEKQTIEELEELIKRQNKLLKNRSFLEKLPDKGKKIQEFKSHLEVEYDKKLKEYETTCELMSKLNLSDENVEELEWNKGKVNDCSSAKAVKDEKGEEEDEDENENEVNPLKLVATHSGTAKGNKKIINADFGVSSDNESNKPCYGDKICIKYGGCEKSKERFKPNQLKNNEKSLFAISAEKVKKRLGNKWEITQATPPVPVFKDTIMISLTESLKLQREHSEKLKEVEKKHAVLKLLENKSVRMGDRFPKHNVTEYRESQNVFDENGEDEEEGLNESDEEY